MKNRSIAFVITRPNIGGAQSWVRDQIKICLDSNEFDNVLLITSKEGWISNVTDKRCHLEYVSSIDSVNPIPATLKISQLFYEYGITTCISNSAHAGLCCRLSKILKINVKHIYVSHGWSAIYNSNGKRRYIIVENFLSKLTCKILCVSEEDRKKAITSLNIKKSKLVTIRNKAFLNAKENTNRTLDDSHYHFLFLGRVEYPKRQDLAIDAFNDLPDNYKLHIIGPDSCKLKSRTNRNVSLYPGDNNFSSYQDYDACILISDSEGLPMSLIESAVRGIPIISSNVGGCYEVVQRNGILVNNEKSSIINAIKELSNNYVTYKNNAKEIAKNHNLESNHKEYIDLYINPSK